MEYNLEKRTFDFSKSILNYLKGIEITNLNRAIISQLIRSATSVGANYREANSASSKKDFINKIAIVRKEINETKYWIELLGELKINNKNDLRSLWLETSELVRIFNKIYHSSKNNI
ncbi:MAG: four helix bundle protein [Candidatus Magasanikbacteria bacterium]